MQISKSAKEKSRVTKEEWRDFTKTVWKIANQTHKKHPATFPPEIPLRLIKLFSFWGESVLDPFAGTGTTAKVAIQLGRKAIGVEEKREYCALINKDLKKHFSKKTLDEMLSIINGDCRSLDAIKNNSVDLIVTSPPYWNKAKYSRNKNNIGNINHYPNFLDEMKKVFKECFRVLQPGRKLCIVTANVNQYTDHGLLTFPIASDFVILLRELGFVMVTEIIWSKDGTGGRWGSSGVQRPIFGSYPFPPNFLFKNLHEYILVFSKPPFKKITNNKRALPYELLMKADQKNGNGNKNTHYQEKADYLIVS